jgi:hypothetical protein
VRVVVERVDADSLVYPAVVHPVGLPIAFETSRAEQGVRHGLFGPTRTHLFSPVALCLGQAYVQRNDLHRSFWSFPTNSTQGRARVARRLSGLHVGDTGGAAFFGEALAQGVPRREQDGALIP